MKHRRAEVEEEKEEEEAALTCPGCRCRRLHPQTLLVESV